MKKRKLGLRKRKWVYCMPPAAYEMAPCKCGNKKTQWSEYEGRLWCDRCKIDFIPKHGGLFDGPIAINVCRLLGIHFDRIYLDSKKRVKVEDYIKKPV